MKLIVYNGYPLSVVVAVIMHTLLLAGLLYLQSESATEITDILQPPIVKAIMLDENPQLRNEQLLEQQRLVRLDQQRQAREQQQSQEQQERQRAEQAAAEQARRQQQELEALQQREREAQQQSERESAALRERQEQDRREAELQRQQQEQQQRQRELAAEQQRQRQAAADSAAAAEIARTEFEMVQAYTGVIHDLVQQNWSRPPSSRNGMTAVVRIQMVPTGDILNVEIVQSSGDAAFDRAAERAIFRVGRFTELQGMPTNMFNSNFRSLLLTFRPEDLLN